jgi:hypothetical protein
MTTMRTTLDRNKAKYPWFLDYRVSAEDDPASVDNEFRTYLATTRVLVHVRTDNMDQSRSTHSQDYNLDYLQSAIAEAISPSIATGDTLVATYDTLGYSVHTENPSVYRSTYRVCLTVDRAGLTTALSDSGLTSRLRPDNDRSAAYNGACLALGGIQEAILLSGRSLFQFTMAHDPIGPAGLTDGEYEVALSVVVTPSDYGASDDEIRAMIKTKMESGDVLSDRFNSASDITFGNPEIAEIAPMYGS